MSSEIGIDSLRHLEWIEVTGAYIGMGPSENGSLSTAFC